jgi:hypothetical protein
MFKADGQTTGRAPGPGLKLGEMDIASSKQQAQATSFKHQASSFRTNPFNRQAASIPTRVTSVKLQA